jgi:propanediol dehydratase small subunit
MGLQYMALLGAIALAAVAVAFMSLAFPRTIRVYWERSCTGWAWKRSCPEASKQDIRKFLHLFVDAFGFRDTRALYFAPADRVLAIYRAMYPVKGWPDALELETFALRLEKVYGADLRGMWRENITLGEVLSKVIRVAPPTPGPFRST